METMGQSNSSYPKSKILQTYVSKSLEGFKDEDDIYKRLLDTRFARMKKLTTPALAIGLNIANAIDVNPLYPSDSRLSLSQYELVRGSTPLSKQSPCDPMVLKNLKWREYLSSSIDPSEGDISETRSFGDMSEANVVIKHHNYSKTSENYNYSRFDPKKPKGIVAGVKRKLDDDKPKSTVGIESKKLKYESVLDSFRTQNNTVFL